MSSLLDISAFQVQPDGTVVQSLASAKTAGTTVSGAQKMTQKFIIALLTRKGSVPYLPKQGTNFLNRFASGMISTEQDLFVNFAAAQVDLGPQLRNEQTINDAPSEKFRRAVLERLFISPEQVDMQIRIDSQLGVGNRILLPLRFQVR